MSDRDEYLQKFKTKLDEWNADIELLEAKAREAQADVEGQYREQLARLREMRDEALDRYTQMQGAAVDAWDEMVQGTDKAWQTWRDAFQAARSKFESKG